jgi:hypothetical protein
VGDEVKLSDIPSQGPFTPKQRRFLRCRVTMADRACKLFDSDFVRALDKCGALDDVAWSLMRGKIVVIRKRGSMKATINAP